MNFYTRFKPAVKKRGRFNKICLVMKFVVLFMTIACLQASATGYAQQVTLSEKNVSLKKVFSIIQKQTKYIVWYENKVLEGTHNIDLTLDKVPLQQALEQCFKDQPITYTIVDKTIVVQKKSTQLPVTPPTNVVIKGQVTDEKGLPLPGVTVKVKGSNNATVSVSDGSFSITVPDKNAVLVFSFVGYATQEMTVDGRSSITVTMKIANSALNDVVVIGYGSVQKRNVTGAISSVKSADLEVSTSSNFAQALQGKASGVEVVQGTGQPGASVSIQLRTNPSFASAGVLYVIDGVPVNDYASTPGTPGENIGGTDQSPLNFINPNDIASIEFLKDASSSAIYGARAGAGVVLITTKRGKNGKPQVDYSGSYATQSVSKMFSTLDTKTYMEQVNLAIQEKWLRANGIAPFGNTDPSTVTPASPRYTQQQIDTAHIYQTAPSAILRTGYTQQHNIAISGGSDKTKYYISGNYYDQQGIVISTDYKRWNGRVNLDQIISDKFKVGVNIITSNSTSNTNGTGGRYEASGILTSALYYPSNLPLQNADGTYPLNPLYTAVPNPLSYTTVTNQVYNTRLLTSAFVDWNIIKDLTAKGNFSYDQSTAKRDVYEPTTFAPGAGVNGLARVANNGSNTKLLEYTLNYDHHFGSRQRLNAIAGYSYNVTNGDGVWAQNQNFSSDAFSYYNLGAGQGTPVVSSGSYKNTWASYFARAMYVLDSKYTLQASIRRDGSDKFAANKKWGYFPSVSASWLLSDEDFFKPVKAINYLKLRASYGEVGNSNIGQNAFAAYGIVAGPVFGTSNSASTGIALTQAANPKLTWETDAEVNLGVDYGLFNNRVTGSVDYFVRTIRNLLTYVPFPSDFTVGGVESNAGTTRATGYELSLQTKNIVTSQKDGFTWSTNFTFSHYLAYWTKRSPQALAVLPAYVAATGKNALFDGVYGYVSDGLYKGGAAPSQMPGMMPGGLIIKDIHGYDSNGKLTGPDGNITSADQTLIGNTDPKFNFGIGNTFTYKHFDLSIYFSGMVKHAWSPYSPNASSSFNVVGGPSNLATFGWNTMPYILGEWSSYNTKSNVPAGFGDPNNSYNNAQSNSTYWWINASYLRCRDITLGYRFPQNILGSQKVISGLRVYVDVQNAFTITKYPGLDPELDQGNFYPLTKGVVFGVNASF